MKRVLCTELPKRGRPVRLNETEAHHVIRVLRLREGDRVEAMDGQGNASVVVLRMKGGPPWLEYLEESENANSGPRLATSIVPVTLEMAVLKGDAMEWALEKTVELGIQTFQPVITAYTVVQLDKKGPQAFQERWQKIADQALKQCGRLQRLEVALPIELEELLQRQPSTPKRPRLWCDEASRLSPQTTQDLLPWLIHSHDLEGTRLLIGPEGGWSDIEREMIQKSSGESTQRIGLGPLVLRAETAAIFAMSLASAAFRSEAMLDKSEQKKRF